MFEDQKSKILVVDDVAENRKMLASTIRKFTDYEIVMASDGQSVLDSIEAEVPDLILLDIMLPEMDGFEVAEKLQAFPLIKDVPIIFITALMDTESKIKAFQAGGVDYVSKPFNEYELLSRINAHLRLKKMHDEMKLKNQLLADREKHLSHLVEEKTKKIEKITFSMVSALENVNLLNDTDTGFHIKRVSEYSALLAEKYGFDREFIKKIKLYASLHDVGKVGIPDGLLKKPGRYTDEENKQMQQHVVTGYRMVDNAEISEMAKNIVLYHHEKWDGSGYVHRLKGEQIPPEARLVSLADVYDALVTKRVYKPAFPEEKADMIIRESSGGHFEPHIVDLFFENKKKILEIRNSLQ